MDYNSYKGGSAQRFDTGFNHPFWNSQVSPGFKPFARRPRLATGGGVGPFLAQGSQLDVTLTRAV